MFERDSLKILDEALSVLEQGFSYMPEFKATPLPPKDLEGLLSAISGHS